MEHIHLSRSLLVTPGDKIQWLFERHNFDADLNLVDLEDGVAELHRPLARQNWAELDPTVVQIPLCLRMNKVTSRDGFKDLQLVIDSALEPQILVLPKVESAMEVQFVGNVLAASGRRTKIWAILESSRGLLNAESIATSSPNLVALSFGAADFAAEVGSTMEWDALLHARSAVLLAARAAGVCAIDSPTFELSNEQLLQQDCLKSKNMGFSGKVAIHPKQIQIINDTYASAASSVNWARQIVERFSKEQNGILLVDGVMVGPPFLARAKNILSKQSALCER